MGTHTAMGSGKGNFQLGVLNPGLNVVVWRKERVDLSGQPPCLPQPLSNPYKPTC